MGKTSVASDVGKSGLIILFGTILSMLGGFLFRIVIANNLQPDEFGSIMLAISLLNIVSIPAVLGLNQGLVKFLPEKTTTNSSKNSYISFSIIIVLATSMILCILLYLVSGNFNMIFFEGDVDDLFISLFILSIPLFSINKVIEGSLRGVMDVKRFVMFTKIVKYYSRVIISGATALVIGSVVSVLAGVCFSLLVTLATGIRYLRAIGWQFNINTDVEIKPLVSFSLPLLISSSIYLLLARVDRVLIGYFWTPTHVGNYEIAITIALLIGSFKSAFSFLVFPKISELNGRENQSGINQLYGQTTKWIIASSTPALLVIIFRPDVLIELFGDQYSVSEIYLPLAILGATLYVDSILGPNGQALLGFGKSKVVMYYNATALITNLVLNIVLIPELGLIGAAIASMVGYSIMNILKSVDLYVNHGIIVLHRSGIKAATVIILFSVPIMYFVQEFEILVEIIFLTTVSISALGVSVGVLWITGDLTDEDRDLIRALSLH